MLGRRDLMTPSQVLQEIKAFVPTAYIMGVNPLPILRKIYPECKFSGGLLDSNRDMKVKNMITFIINVENEAKLYFLHVE